MNREKLAWVLSVVLVAVLAFQLPGSMATRDNDYAWVSTLVDVHRRVADNYVETPESCPTLYAGQSALEWSKLVAERYVEVVADEGINAKVPSDVWDRAVDVLIENIKRDKPADGYVEAIGICGEVLAEHFPPRKRKKNELPDRLILI